MNGCSNRNAWVFLVAIGISLALRPAESAAIKGLRKSLDKEQKRFDTVVEDFRYVLFAAVDAP